MLWILPQLLSASVSADSNVGFDYLCDRTNFKACRLRKIIEDNECVPQIYGHWFGDPLFLVVTIFVTGFYVLHVSADFDPQPSEAGGRKVQIKPPRGLIYWRVHLGLYAVSFAMKGIHTCLIVKDGGAKNAFIVLHGAANLAAIALLIYIGFLDCMYLEENIVLTVIGIVWTALWAILWLAMAGGGTKTGLVALGLVVPLFFQFLWSFVMVAVAIARKLPKLALFSLAMTAIVVVCWALELFASGLFCEGAQGWWTAESMSVFIYAAYRVAAQFFFRALKADERLDGNALKQGADGKPLLIEVEDYSYSYSGDAVDVTIGTV